MVALSLSRVTRRVLGVDMVAGGNQHLDDGDLIEITDIGYQDFGCCCHENGLRTTTGYTAKGIGFLGVDAVLLHGIGNLLRGYLAFVGERLERGHGHVVPVHLEETFAAACVRRCGRSRPCQAWT